VEEIELSRVEPEGIEDDARRRFVARPDDSSESLLASWNDMLNEGLVGRMMVYDEAQGFCGCVTFRGERWTSRIQSKEFFLRPSLIMC
jgi:hypothetical protein